MSDFEGKKLLELRTLLYKEKPNTIANVDVPVRNARAPMPDAIRLEISGLFERRRVSEVLQSPEMVQGIERVVRDGAERGV